MVLAGVVQVLGERRVTLPEAFKQLSLLLGCLTLLGYAQDAGARVAHFLLLFWFLVLAVSSVAVSVSVCTRVNTVRNWCLPCFAYSGVFCGMQVSVSGVMLSFELHYDTEYWYHTRFSAFGGRRNKKQAKI